MQGRTGRTWSLSLVIPAFNEEAGIAQAIAEADESLARIAGDYEILVVDDGSSDDTFAVAGAAAAGRSKVRILRHERNRGYGAALRTGFEAARFEHVAFTDADCQFDLNDLARLVPLADEAPIVAGFRIDRKDPWRRRFLSRGYNLLARTLLGTRVRDCDCALKVFRRDALARLLPESPNFFVNTEMLTRAGQLDFDIVEVGVTHRPRAQGASKVSMLDVPKTLATLLPFWWSRVMFPGPMTGAVSLVGQIRKRTASSDRAEPVTWLLIAALAAVMFFCRLRTPLLEPEEARYAEIPRQMTLEGRWLVPVLHGQPYLDKPPLTYWMVMGSYSVFGVHDWAARIVPGLCGWLTIMIAYAWARRVAGGRAALCGAVILCLSAQFIYYGRMLTMNMPLALCVTGAAAAAHLAATTSIRRHALFGWAAAGAALGLGVLAKGPVALALVLPPLWLLLRLDPRLHRPGAWGWALLAGTTLAAAAPWYIAITIRHPQFAEYFFWFHNVLRFTQPFDHEGPPWQYLPSLLAANLPWTLLIVPLAALLARRSMRTAVRRPPALGWFLLTALWMVAFYSAAGSKRPVYIVPVLPPLALALGAALDAILPRVSWASAIDVLRRHRSALAWAATTLVLVGGIAAGAVGLEAGLKRPERGLAAIMISVAVLAYFLSRVRSRRASWLWVGGTTAALAAFGVHELLPEYAARFSMRHTANMHAWRAADAKPTVFCYPHRFDSISFYVREADVRGYSRPNRSQLINEIERRPRSLVFVQSRFLEEFLELLPPTLEAVTHQLERNVSIVEVRRRREAPVWMARGD